MEQKSQPPPKVETMDTPTPSHCNQAKHHCTQQNHGRKTPGKSQTPQNQGWKPPSHRNQLKFHWTQRNLLEEFVCLPEFVLVSTIVLIGSVLPNRCLGVTFSITLDSYSSLVKIIVRKVSGNLLTKILLSHVFNVSMTLRHYAIMPLCHYAITPLRHYAITPVC